MTSLFSSYWLPRSGWSPPFSGNPLWPRRERTIRMWILWPLTYMWMVPASKQICKRRLQVVKETLGQDLSYFCTNLKQLFFGISILESGVVTALVTAGPADLYNRVLCPTCILQIIAINTLLVRYNLLTLQFPLKTILCQYIWFFFQFSAQLLFWSTVTLLPNAPTWSCSASNKNANLWSLFFFLYKYHILSISQFSQLSVFAPKVGDLH